MSPEEEKERVRLLVGSLERHVAMAAFVPPDADTPDEVTNSATVSFLTLPTGKFLVTNHHVWDEFTYQRKTDEGLRLVVFGSGVSRPVDISNAELVDADQGIDLAMLRFERTELIENIGKSFYEPQRFPLDTAVEGDDVVFVGFPGNRKETIQHYLRFESALVAPKVGSVSDRKLLLHFESVEPILHQFSRRPITKYRWGGMSGSMAYRVDPEINKHFVVGFVRAAGEGLNANFYAGRADLIREDGTIRRE